MTDIALSFRHADGAMRSDLTRCLDFMNGTPFFRRYKQETWDALQISGNSSILDVACGFGFDVVELARRFPRANVYGLDPSQGFLGLARERAQGLANARFVAGNSRRLPFSDGCFDTVRIDRSLQYISAPIEALREMVRVTRKGGKSSSPSPIGGHSSSTTAISQPAPRSPKSGRSLSPIPISAEKPAFCCSSAASRASAAGRMLSSSGASRRLTSSSTSGASRKTALLKAR